VRTIRFYEQSELLPYPSRTPAGYRFYDQDAVTRLRFVRSAQALGLSLAEIADVLRIRDHQVSRAVRARVRAVRRQSVTAVAASSSAHRSTA
jgi:DNA-binding transcriptional MerR regulator